MNLIDERNKQIDQKIDESPAGTLYNITRMTSENVKFSIKRSLNSLAQNKVRELYNKEPDLKSYFGDESVVLDSWRRRYYKIAKISLVKDEVKKYCDLYRENM